MKFFLALFTIALVAQVSLAENSDYLTFKNLMLGELKTKMHTLTKALPVGDAYKKYNEDFEMVLEMLEEKTNDISCLTKLVLTLGKMNHMFDTIKADESEQAKKVMEICKEHKDEAFQLKLKAALEKAMDLNSSETDDDFC